MDNQYIIWTIIFAVILLAVARLVILTRQKNENKLKPADPHTSNTPIAAAGKEVDQKRNIRILVLVFGVAVLVGLIVYTVFTKGDSGSSEPSSASMIPIWVAVMVPFIAMKKKKDKGKEERTEKEKRIFMIVISLLLAGLIAGLVLTLINNQ